MIDDVVYADEQIVNRLIPAVERIAESLARLVALIEKAQEDSDSEEAA